MAEETRSAGPTTVLVVMGVSGTGKSTVAELLAAYTDVIASAAVV